MKTLLFPHSFQRIGWIIFAISAAIVANSILASSSVISSIGNISHTPCSNIYFSHQKSTLTLLLHKMIKSLFSFI